MSKFYDKFGRNHVVLPVIHVRQYDETLENIELAREHHADGVWLIDHGNIDNATLSEWQRKAIDDTGWNNIGVNFLGLPTIKAFRLADNRGLGVWTDNAYVDNDTVLTSAIEINEHRHLLADGLYFGGVAFKYQKQPSDLMATVELSTEYVDVITTSGPGTGRSADVRKIKTIWKSCGSTPIAIASGITPDNVEDYLPHTNAFLVATGISKTGDFYNIDPIKLDALVAVVHNFD